jgi:hypothetical protein
MLTRESSPSTMCIMAVGTASVDGIDESLDESTCSLFERQR